MIRKNSVIYAEHLPVAREFPNLSRKQWRDRVFGNDDLMTCCLSEAVRAGLKEGDYEHLLGLCDSGIREALKDVYGDDPKAILKAIVNLTWSLQFPPMLAAPWTLGES